MSYEQIAVWALGALFVALTGAFKMVWSKTEKNSKELADQARHVAETYLTKSEHSRQQERLEDKLDKILEKLDRKQDKVVGS